MRAERLLRDVVACMSARRRPIAVRSKLAHVIPVVWPPLAVMTWPWTKFDQGVQRKKITPAASSGWRRPAERDDLRRGIAHLLRQVGRHARLDEAERDSVDVDLERRPTRGRASS